MASKDHSLDSGIAQAAYKEFLTCGFQKASLHKIAENAGVTTGAIYTRYQNKDALCVSLLQGFFKTMEEIFSSAEQEYERARKSARAEDIIRAINVEKGIYFHLPVGLQFRYFRHLLDEHLEENQMSCMVLRMAFTYHVSPAS